MWLFKQLHYDMTNDVILPDCTNWFSRQAKNILMLLQEEPIEEYSNVTEMDRRLIVKYWQEYDGLTNVILKGNIGAFGEWFTKKATNMEVITRATRWLRENEYIIIKPEVEKEAHRKAEIISGRLRK